MKSGTTSLYHYLRSHPDIFIPAIKEPCFFSNKTIWERGIKWYESLFNGYGNSKAIGEASTNYTKYPIFPNVPERIASIESKMKLIYILRHPIDRIYSQYVHNFYFGNEINSIEDVIMNKPQYIQISLYYKQIDQYLKYFPKEQLLIIILEDMEKDALKIIKNVFEFLNVETTFIPPNITERRNQTKYKRGPDNKLMKILKKLPIYHNISSRLSDNIKAKFKVLLKRKIESPELLSNELYNILVEEVSGDLEKLRTFLKRDLKCWNMNKR